MTEGDLEKRGEMDLFFENQGNLDAVKPAQDWLTFDMAGLSASEREDASILLGGSAATYVEPGDRFRGNQVSTVVFRWGDMMVENSFANFFGREASRDYLPFNLSTVVGDWVWMLDLIGKEFDPDTEYRSYVALPFDKHQAVAALAYHNQLPVPRPHLLGCIGGCWVRFSPGTDIGPPEMSSIEQNVAEIEHLNTPELE